MKRNYPYLSNLVGTLTSFLVYCTFSLLIANKALADGPDENIAPVRGGLSGSWYDPSRDGEGFVFEFAEVPSGKMATVYWFTHKDGAPYWLIGSTSYDSEDFDDLGTLEFELFEVSGTGFGRNFDAGELTRKSRGTIGFVFEDCARAIASWSAETGSDYLETDTLTYELQRITLGLDAQPCDGSGRPSTDDSSSESTLAIGGNYSGSWFDSDNDGEGFVLEFGEVLQEKRVLSAFWFAHKQGKPYWLLGTAEYTAESREISVELFEYSGTDFGTQFSSEDVQASPQGSIVFRFTGCNEGLATWEMSNNQATGLFDLSRITQKLDDIACKFNSPERLSVSTQPLTDLGNPVDLDLSSSNEFPTDPNGVWLVRTSDGSLYRKILITSDTPKRAIDIDDAGFYEAIFYSSQPTPRLSSNHHFAVTTPLSHNVTTDIILDKAGSPYRLADSIQIRQNSTLTISSGTTIFGNSNGVEAFGENSIQAFGKLVIKGTADNPVVMYRVNLDPGNTRSEGPYFQLDLTGLIMLQGSLYRGGSAGYGSLNVKDSAFFDLKDYSYIWYPTSTARITRSIFWGTNEISFGVNDTDVEITNNLFKNYSNFYHEGVLQNWATYGDSAVVVEGNSFLDPGKTTVGVRTDGEYAARRNYWGTTDRDTIEDMIYDGNDDFGIPQIIEFEPFLREPDPDTPTLEDCAAKARHIPALILYLEGNPSFCD